MKTLEITGYKRSNSGKAATKRLRQEGQVPCVLYGGKEHVHLHIDMVALKGVIYTPDVFFINLHVEGATYTCIVKEQQFHPVNEMVLHVDFLQIFEDKKIQMYIPIRPVGISPGVAKGGLLLKKLRRLRVFALPKHMPSYIDVDISSLDLGNTAKVKNLAPKNYVIQEQPNIPVVSIGIPRALRSQESEKAKASSS